MGWKKNPEQVRADRKHKLVIALVCGPLFTILFYVIYLFCMKLSLPSDNPLEDSNSISLKIAGVTSLAAMAAVADRLGRFFKLSAQAFAGAAAFSCAVGLAILAFILMAQGIIS